MFADNILEKPDSYPLAHSFHIIYLYILYYYLKLLNSQSELSIIIYQIMENTDQLPLAQLFAKQANSLCSQCGRASRQWADLKHAIFLCLNCAAAYKEFAWTTQIKSIGLDEWSEEEIQRMERGGNEAFANFMKAYDLDQAEIRIKVTSQAAAYYRVMLEGKMIGVQPTF